MLSLASSVPPLAMERALYHGPNLQTPMLCQSLIAWWWLQWLRASYLDHNDQFCYWFVPIWVQAVSLFNFIFKSTWPITNTVCSALFALMIAQLILMAFSLWCSKGRCVVIYAPDGATYPLGMLYTGLKVSITPADTLGLIISLLLPTSGGEKRQEEKGDIWTALRGQMAFVNLGVMSLCLQGQMMPHARCFCSSAEPAEWFCWLIEMSCWQCSPHKAAWHLGC